MSCRIFGQLFVATLMTQQKIPKTCGYCFRGEHHLAGKLIFLRKSFGTNAKKHLQKIIMFVSGGYTCLKETILDSYCAALLFFAVNNVGSRSEYIMHWQPEFWMQDSLPKHDESVKNFTRSVQYNVLAVLRYLSCS
jgi:hypothetical protein